MSEQHRLDVRGSGRVELPAYGLADAEHQVEKEVLALWPEAAVQVLDVGRANPVGNIVEEFRITYRVRGVVGVVAPSEDEARKSALRALRDRFTGSRFERIAWEVA